MNSYMSLALITTDCLRQGETHKNITMKQRTKIIISSKVDIIGEGVVHSLYNMMVVTT